MIGEENPGNRYSGPDNPWKITSWADVLKQWALADARRPPTQQELAAREDPEYRQRIMRAIEAVNYDPEAPPNPVNELFRLKDSYIFALKQQLLLEKCIYELPEEIRYLRQINGMLRAELVIGAIGCIVSATEVEVPEGIKVNNNAFINLELDVVSDQINGMIEPYEANQKETARYLEAKRKETLGRICDLSPRASTLRDELRNLRHERGVLNKRLEKATLARMAGCTLAIAS